MAKSSRVQITLPDEVYAWFTDLAALNHTTPQQEIRRVLIEGYLHRYNAPLPAALAASPHVVYFVQHPETGHIKVGATSNFQRRFNQLQTEAASILTPLGFVHFEHRDEAFGHEHAIKMMFKSAKVKGEWFQPTAKLMDFVRHQSTVSMPLDGLLGTLPIAEPGPRRSKTGYKGVYPYGRRFEAVVYTNGQRQRLGVYGTAEMAARAYDNHLVAERGDPNAAVNFPSSADVTAQTSAPFIEQFASGGKLSDLDWQRWQQQAPAGPALDAPLSVRPEGSGPPIDASTPLIDRPAKSLYRREPTPTSRPDPDPDDDENLS